MDLLLQPHRHCWLPGAPGLCGWPGHHRPLHCLNGRPADPSGTRYAAAGSEVALNCDVMRCDVMCPQEGIQPPTPSAPDAPTAVQFSRPMSWSAVLRSADVLFCDLVQFAYKKTLPALTRCRRPPAGGVHHGPAACALRAPGQRRGLYLCRVRQLGPDQQRHKPHECTVQESQGMTLLPPLVILLFFTLLNLFLTTCPACHPMTRLTAHPTWSSTCLLASPCI